MGTIQETTHLDMLPCELQQLIITSLDDDPYTLLNLPLVSKKWHYLLMTGKRATEEWERRCRKLGAKRKSPLATRSTWYSTFVELASRRCACCLAHTSCNVGHLLVYGFKYVALCEACQVKNQPGPFQMIPIDHLHAEGVDIARQLLSVPQRTRDRPGRFKFSANVKDGRVYALRAAVEQAKILLDKEKSLSERLVKSCPMADKKINLEAAFAYHRQLTHPQCLALSAAICRLHAATTPTLYQYETVISLYETLQVILAEREALSTKTAINIADLSIVMNQEVVLGTEDGKQEEEERKTWIEALAQDQADLPNFFKTVKKEQIKNRIRRRYEKLLEKERKALEPPLCDYRSPKNRESCDSDADEGCEEKKCFRHCWGPCEVHPETFSSSFSSFEDEQDSLNIPLSDVDDW